MIEQDVIDNITQEEVLREEIRASLQKQKTKGKAVWSFLNSNFGLFILSTVVIGFSTWIYTEYKTNVQQEADRAILTMKISTELEYRFALIHSSLEALESVPDTFVWRTVWDINDIWRGNTETGGYSPVFEEFANKTLAALVLEFINTNSERAMTSQVTMVGLFVYPQTFINNLIDQDLNLKSGFSKSDRESLKNTVLTARKNYRKIYHKYIIT
ncbi:MAG: hypothetical protein RLP14_10325 [Owenweeksia sp.]